MLSYRKILEIFFAKEHIERINLKINELKQINLNILQDDIYLIIFPH